MFGGLTVDGVHECFTLEDELREDKVMGETAIPAGSYQLGLRKSPKFGPDTIEVLGVPGFSDILIHSGNRDEDTAGCVLVGDAVDWVLGTISGGIARGVLAKLKSKVKTALEAGEKVTLHVLNAPGDRYVDSGNLAQNPERATA